MVDFCYDIQGQQNILHIQHLLDNDSWEWREILNAEFHDRKDHYIRYVQVCRLDTPYKNRFLQVIPAGPGSCLVNMAGDVKDMSTLFTVHMWMDSDLNNEVCQFICSGGPCSKYVLYLDKDILRAKPAVDDDVDAEVDDKSSLFKMEWNKSFTTFSLKSYMDEKHFLAVDEKGHFEPLDRPKGKDNPFRQFFKPLLVQRITSV